MDPQKDYDLTLAIATRVYEEESRAIRSHRYGSQRNKQKDLQYSQAVYEEARALLEGDATSGFGDDEYLNDLSDQLRAVSQGTLRFAYGAIKNLSLRREYISVTGKITEVYNGLLHDIHNSPEYRANTLSNNGLRKNAKTLLQSLEKHITDMKKLLAEWGTRSYPALTPQAFGQDWIVTFNETRKTFIANQNDRWNSVVNKNKYNPKAKLSKLSTSDQISVAKDTFINIEQADLQLMRIFRSAGEGLALLTAVIMVWQIVQSDHRLEASARAAFSIPPAILAGQIGAEAGAWLLGVLSGPGGALLGAIFGGLIGGFAGGLAADSLFDAILYYLSSSTPDLLISRLFGPPLYYELTLPDSRSLTKSLMERLI